MCSSQERKTDLVKKCFKPECGVSETIWKANNLLNPCATIVFTALSVCAANGTIDITITKKDTTTKMITLSQGQSQAITIDQIDRIDVLCSAGATGLCAINLCMIIHYDCC